MTYVYLIKVYTLQHHAEKTLQYPSIQNLWKQNVSIQIEILTLPNHKL